MQSKTFLDIRTVEHKASDGALMVICLYLGEKFELNLYSENQIIVC